jgi:hypothetical protein
MVAYLHRRHYRPDRRPLRACHPRDLLDQVAALCRYRGLEPTITRELLDAACEAYFVGREPDDEEGQTQEGLPHGRPQSRVAQALPGLRSARQSRKRPVY